MGYAPPHAGMPMVPMMQVPVMQAPVMQAPVAPVPTPPPNRTSFARVSRSLFKCCCWPAEPDAKNRIDKLVDYLRKNGSSSAASPLSTPQVLTASLACVCAGMQFEQVVRDNQRGNPEFAFLIGGEHSDYYRWRIFCVQNSWSEGDHAWLKLCCC
jgi:hypothetical protein